MLRHLLIFAHGHGISASHLSLTYMHRSPLILYPIYTLLLPTKFILRRDGARRRDSPLVAFAIDLVRGL